MSFAAYLALQGEILAVAWYATRSPLMLGISAFFVAAALLAKLIPSARRRQSRLGEDGHAQG